MEAPSACAGLAMTASSSTRGRVRWARCQLCGLGLGHLPDSAWRAPIVCAGCTERLELELAQGLIQPCDACNRHPELCSLRPCGQQGGRVDDPASANPVLQPLAPIQTGVAWIDIDDIREGPEELNVRSHYDERAILELTASVQQHGLLHPVGVRAEPGGYSVVYGARRLRAARRAGLKRILCTIREADEQRALVLSLVENLHRRQLSGKERVRAIEKLAATRLGVRELSRQTGLDQSTISRWLKIDRRPTLRAALEQGMIDIGRATILADAPEDVLPSLLPEAAALPQAELRERVRQLKALRKPTPLMSPNSRRLADVLQLMRMVDRPSPGDQLILEDIGREIERLQIERALA